MTKKNGNGQNSVATSAQENEDINYADTMYDAFLKSMTWFVGGKGVVVTIKDSDTNVWVEKSASKNKLIYKFLAENGGRKRSVEINSATWWDYSLFSGDTIKSICNHLNALVNYMIKKG